MKKSGVPVGVWIAIGAAAVGTIVIVGLAAKKSIKDGIFSDGIFQ